MIDVLYVILGLIAWILLYKITQYIDNQINNLVHQKREVQFLRMVRVWTPDAKTIESISIAKSDKIAMANIERRLRESSRYL
jgi:hypothetical protein